MNAVKEELELARMQLELFVSKYKKVKNDVTTCEQEMEEPCQCERRGFEVPSS